MPYHVRITLKSNSMSDEVRLDLTEEELTDRFIEPYMTGTEIVTGGKTIEPSDIDRIRINYTPEDSSVLIPIIQAERHASKVIGPISDKWYVTKKGYDVTDKFIVGPPGQNKPKAEIDIKDHGVDNKKVFVIHGRNEKLREAIFQFLRALRLEPIEWSEAIEMTGKASPYIGEILDVAFSKARAIVVLMTPDDLARLNELFLNSSDELYERELTPQARPNVLFEAGFAMGRNEKGTILVECGKLRPFSDKAGRHVIKMDNSSKMRNELANRLETAGCVVNKTGSDWLSIGDFAVENILNNIETTNNFKSEIGEETLAVLLAACRRTLFEKRYFFQRRL